MREVPSSDARRAAAAAAGPELARAARRARRNDVGVDLSPLRLAGRGRRRRRRDRRAACSSLRPSARRAAGRSDPAACVVVRCRSVGAAPPTTASQLVVQAAGAVAEAGRLHRRRHGARQRSHRRGRRARRLTPIRIRSSSPRRSPTASGCTCLVSARRLRPSVGSSSSATVERRAGPSISIVRVRPISSRCPGSVRRSRRRSSTIASSTVRSDRSTTSPTCEASARRRWSSCDRW